ncbi:elongation factor G [Candidatus Magnetomonas plexicatena]|uniref:elongation factor G n=1 Tax=Candidatus Magnetomonas plexicatena TaxID=2552947 RepID=UPI001C744785|nr:elongation factor G [Nitrospirales bacterium LBB_01]
MGNTEVGKIRNIALVGHSGSGKTTLTEALLLSAGVIGRMGTVSDGNTVSDFDPEEIERMASITSAVATFDYSGHKINVMDTPGFINFIEDARGCLRVADCAIIVIGAESGVKAETQKIWNYITEFETPAMVFVNEIDKENANFYSALEQAQDAFSIEPLPVMLPIGEAAAFNGYVDLLKMKAYIFKGTGFEETAIPSDMSEKAAEYRKKLVEVVAEADDALLEKYLETGELTDDEVINGVQDGVNRRCFLPVTCGSAEKNLCIKALLDSILFCVPSPADRVKYKPVTAKNLKDNSDVVLKPESAEHPAAYVLKTVADPYAGKLTIFRVFSGTFRPDTTIFNSSKGVKERIGQVLYMLGKKQTPAQVLGPGEIGVVAKLKETGTGDTLCNETTHVKLPDVKFAEPIISYAIEPKTKGDEEKVSSGLHRILDEDPTLRFHREDETNEMIISGMGQVHIEVTLHKLKRKFGVEVEMKTPTIAYRETITARAKAQGKYKKQSGGRGQYGDCWIEIEPLPRSSGFEYVDKVVGGSVPRQYIPAVEKGIVEKLKGGIIAGYPMVDIRVTIFDGSYHAVDSSEMAFKIAGSFAIKKAVADAHPVILEPVMKMEAVCPDENLGAVIGDLNSKRGKVQGMDSSPGGNQKVTALVPMSEMLTYANQLHSITSGRGLYTMEFSHYEELPQHLAQKIISERTKKDEEE